MTENSDFPRFYEVTDIHAEKLSEGARVDEDVIGFFSSYQKANEAILDMVQTRSVDQRGRARLGFFIEEVLMDCVNKWVRALPCCYHRTWLLDGNGQEICRTPGIDELWQSGTTKTPQVYQVGDLVAYIENKINSKTGVREKFLKAGVVTWVPRRRNPSDLKNAHKTKFHDDSSADITDEYLWYWVEPSNQPYCDQQRCQTAIYPLKIKINAARQKSLDILRRKVIH